MPLFTPLYPKHVVPYSYDELESLIAQTPLVGFPDCHAINASIVCNEAANSVASRLIVTAVENWEASTKFCNPIAQIEFLHHPGSDERLGLRGAVLYDTAKRAIFHFVNALIGYDGRGTDLSHDILRVLGVSDGMFDDINGLASPLRNKNQPFIVIVRLDDKDRWQFEFI